MLKTFLRAVRRARGHKERVHYRLLSASGTRPKVGVSYSVWDGEELLEFAIRSIRSEVDYVSVAWQRLSWYGNPCDPGLEQHLLNLKEKGLIDELLFFEPDLSLPPGINETNKRNVGLEAARRAGCKYFLTLDADEFFEAEPFREALDYVMRNSITHSACNQVGYTDIDCRKSLPADWFVPFAYRISRGEKFVHNAFGETPWLIDPTKKIPITSESRICFIGQVIMHHYSGVRKNLDRKIENSSASLTPQMTQANKDRAEQGRREVESGLLSGNYVKVPNRFGIRIE